MEAFVMKIRSVFILIVLMLTISIIIQGEASGLGGTPTSFTELNIAIRGKNYFKSSTGISGAIINQINGYQWTVDNKVYNITTTKFDLAIFTNMIVCTLN